MAATAPGIFDESLRQKLLASKVLVVGAGGIGCEILKNLVLTGFPHIEIIDLDTIDISNLNRQFLFHKEHVGKSKAEVARQSALNFNPNVHIEAYHDSITTSNYGVSFFQKFNLVLNALDNRKARNHVNRMCLAADIPLIESGTAGYNGQVELIKKNLTQCYECTPKQVEKTYPGCTIRNTPSEPIHCIVWAKHLFNQLFGEANEDEEVSPDTADPDNTAEAGANALTSEADEAGNIKRVNTREWAKKSNYDPQKIFNKLFYDDIKYLLTMSNLWKSRKPPQPVKWEHLLDTENISEKFWTSSSEHIPWSLSECLNVFANSIKELSLKLSNLNDDDHLVWDKDEMHAMNFVAACANIRATIFDITRKSRFEIKSMAGNIIPAIATTNAITAGISVMHALKVLQGQFHKCCSVYIRLKPNPRNQIFVPEKFLSPPKPDCCVCSDKHEITISVDTKKMTVKEFNDEVLINALSFQSPDVTMASRNILVISSEEGETEQNNSKKLCECHIVHGEILVVDDFDQNYNLSVIIVHKDAKRDEPIFEILDGNNVKPEPKDINKNGSAKSTETKEVGNNHELDNEEAKTNKGAGKRYFDNPCEGPSTSKLAKVSITEDTDDEDDLFILESTSSNITEAVNVSGSGIKRVSDANEGPSTSKKARIVIEDNDDDDDLIILDD